MSLKKEVADPEACNYDATATDDNGTCSYPEILFWEMCRPLQ